MNTQNNTFNAEESKYCSRCKKTKLVAEFIRQRGNKIETFSICNPCAERDRQNKKNVRSANTKSALPLTLIHDENTEILIEDNGSNEDSLLYDLCDLEGFVLNNFKDSEQKNEQVEFSTKVKIERELINNGEMLSPEFDQDKEVEKFRNIINILIISLQAGSGYYWELRNLYINQKNSQYIGCATAYLGCTQRLDRQYKNSNDQPAKRVSEARPPIERYPCNRSITIKIDLCEQHAIISIKHLIAHEHPTYRETNLPINAIEWIKQHINYSPRKFEFYKLLCDENLINPLLHTYQQVYYWVHKLSSKLYITDVANQLKSAKNFLEQKELTDIGYKVIQYRENDFVRSLGFITPFLYNLNKDQISEIVIDSTFKTNQEQFELFSVNMNCGGYGVPLAYLYVDTYAASVECLSNPNNVVHTRVGVLKEFFVGLRNEGILPAFILLDKDSGEIAATQEAWSQVSVIQLCLWHVEHAIERKLKEKTSRRSQYSAQKAIEANKQFAFIDPKWLPDGQQNAICPEKLREELLRIVKKHAILHPLIPVEKNTFLTAEQIYYQSVSETYQFCKLNKLPKLWGYLWVNWYNKKDWMLFARASYSKAMPIARTTMITESHWRVLKYNYKYNCNRPRLDRLTQILTKELVPDMENAWRRFCYNRDFPSWWDLFKHDWKNALEKDVNTEDIYYTNTSIWVCSCPAFIYSPYLICKHLVNKYSTENPGFFPRFLTTTRRHDYPLISFDNSNLQRINLGNNPWNNAFYVNVEVEEPEITSSMRTFISNQHEIIEDKKVELKEDMKMYETLVKIISENINNDKLFEAYKTLKQPLIAETIACTEALNARTQQRTWKPPKNKKLAFWLQ